MTIKSFFMQVGTCSAFKFLMHFIVYPKQKDCIAFRRNRVNDVNTVE